MMEIEDKRNRASSSPPTIELIGWSKDEGPESLFRAAELARIKNQKREQEHNKVVHGKRQEQQRQQQIS
jgi:hypothetical protein